MVTATLQYNNKVDIWALGFILYELTSGWKPFANDWEVGDYGRGCGVRLHPLEYPGGLEESAGAIVKLNSLCGKMFARSPDDRPSALQVSPLLAKA